MIQSKFGEVVDVVVSRGGKMKSLAMRIPQDLMEKYLRVP